MTVRPAPLAAVPDDPKPAECERCKSNATILKDLRAKVRQLTSENERLLNAVHRESHYMDERVMRNK